jgi:hypothetical protein
MDVFLKNAPSWCTWTPFIIFFYERFPMNAPSVMHMDSFYFPTDGVRNMSNLMSIKYVLIVT